MVGYRSDNYEQRKTIRSVFPMNIKIIFGIFFLVIISSNSSTDGHRERWENDLFTNETLNRNYFHNVPLTDYKRNSRFLSFNNDPSHVRVEMVFAIPFLSIPVGRQKTDVTDNQYGNLSTPPKLDVNLKSLMAMGGILITLFLIVPKLVRLYFPNERYAYRRVDEMPSKFETMLHQMDEAFRHHNLDSEGCAKKAVCWIFNDAATKVQSGKANGFEKILDGVSSMFPLSRIFGNLWKWYLLEDAIEVSKNGLNSCEYFHRMCPVTKTGINKAIFKLLPTF